MVGEGGAKLTERMTGLFVEIPKKYCNNMLRGVGVGEVIEDWCLGELAFPRGRAAMWISGGAERKLAPDLDH